MSQYSLSIPGGKVPLAGKGCYPAGPVRKKHQPVPEPPSAVSQAQFRSDAFPVGEMPYQLKVRRLVEQKLRSPHRGFLPLDLVRVTAHWVHIPKGSIPWKDNSDVIVNGRSGGIAPYKPTATKTKDPSQLTNVRAIIVPGMGETEHCITRSLVRSIHVVGAGSSENCVSSYGDIVPSDTDKGLISSLVKIIRQQSGADLSNVHWHKLAEFTYSSGPPTVFFTPVIKGNNPPVFSPQMTTDADGAEIYPVTPLKFTLGSLLDCSIHADTPRDTVEFCMAADALDEWGRRDMAHQILKILRVRKHEASQKSDIDKATEEQQGNIKRRRDAEEGERKIKRQQRDQKIRERWRSHDEGLTDEEKRTAMRSRQAVLKDMRQADAAEDSELAKQWEAEEKEMALKAPQLVPVQELQPEYLEAFRYFDRKEEGSITRMRLHNILLCLDEELTLGEVTDLLNLPQLPRKQAHLPYRKLALLTKMVAPETIPKETPPPEDAAEEEINPSAEPIVSV
eukprot:TRINITY_DN7309_c0_g1_i1.p1 TRINITY_DN7309_c0_g1~~TRINITY_DN7309_c0_g1_i1.p1  ORF type:complete len:507 (+),score=83.95 TRINITY_DN7309_c0_g1_i1:62-1582(+)